MNAIAYSDYENLPEIKIGIHPTKIEIYNPGSFPFNLSSFDFINKNLPSYKRNKLMLDILFRSKNFEKAEPGFQRVNKLCNQYGVSWTFRKEPYGFFFKFIRPNVQINVHLNVELSAQEQMIYNLIDSNLRISKAELAIRIGKSEKTFQSIVNFFIEKKVVIRVGSNKTGHWEVNKLINKSEFVKVTYR